MSFFCHLNRETELPQLARGGMKRAACVLSYRGTHARLNDPGLKGIAALELHRALLNTVWQAVLFWQGFAGDLQPTFPLFETESNRGGQVFRFGL